MNNRIIEVKNIFKGYKAKPNNVLILKDVSLEISKGEFVVIFGPSGSGKSTLLNIITGLERPTKGSVLFNGRDISNLTEDELAEFRKRNIGIVYQQPYWVKSLSVVENVALPLVLIGSTQESSQAAALKILSSLGMKDWAEYHPFELSSGQQQKISLARALITEPDIIIADEPTGNLDYNSGQSITAYLRDLSESGKTVIMVTHNLANLDYAKRVINIFDGRITDDLKLTTSNLEDIKQSLIEDKDKEVRTEETRVRQDLTQLIERQNKLHKEINTKRGLGNILDNLKHILVSITIGTLLVFYQTIDAILSIKVIPGLLRSLKLPLNKLFRNTIDNFKRNTNSISYFDIFSLSLRLLFSKRNRTIITIGGIAFGIGFTAFLISIGYGLERLVISRSSELEQLRQIEVFPSIGESIIIDDASIATIKDISNVDKVMPVITAAGKVNYQNSNIDVVVYGVQSDYLKLSDSALIAGEFFESNDNTVVTPISFPSSVNQLSNESSERKTVVSVAFLELIGLTSADAVGTEFKLGYIQVNNVNGQDSNTLNFYDYEIVGVISDTESPIIYTPINEVKNTGINEYSQLRIAATDQSKVFSIRQQLNVLGFRTASVLDTIAQIESFFSNARVIFSIVGLVALAIASLGMFNTLTVSLLERTREIGLLKSMGMKSKEIREMFLSEAIIMGVYGGITGIILGILLGVLLSFIISSISILRGYEGLSITYLPLGTIVLIIFVSALTGISTGFYPARRATKISALDALRYE